MKTSAVSVSRLQVWSWSCLSARLPEFVGLAWQLRGAGASYRRPARRMFAFSIVYLFALFAALLIDSGAKSAGIAWPSIVSIAGA